jgi:ABC-2 type transport system permease protein
MFMGIIKMEYKKLLKQMLIWFSVAVGYSSLVMVFYIAFSGTIDEMTELFNDASLQGLLKAFSMDTNTFSHILSFYSSYNAIYTILLGCIFASIVAVHMFAREVKEGTFEFTYSNPVSRLKFYFSKTAVVFSFVILLNLALFLTGFVLLEALKEESPRVPWMTEKNKEIVVDAVTGEKDKFLEVFKPDDELFNDYLYSTALDSVDMMDEAEKKELNISDEEIKLLINSFIEGPEKFLEDIKKNPDAYLKMFNIKEEDKEDFLKNIDSEIQMIYYARTNIDKEPDIGIELFKANPKPFLEDILTRDALQVFKTSYGFTDSEIDSLFIYYSLKNFASLSFSVFLIMMAVSSICILLSVLIKRGRFSTGFAVGIALFFYFLDMIANITKEAEFLKHFTPFSYKDMGVMNIEFGVELWRTLILLGVIIISTAAGALIFKKRDMIN